MAFPENLKKLREMRGISQQELAESAHVVQQMIAKYESGMTMPNVAIGVMLADRLGTTVEKLVKGDD